MQHVSQGNTLLWHDPLKHTHTGLLTATHTRIHEQPPPLREKDRMWLSTTSLLVQQGGREKRKGRGEKLGETLVFFFPLSLLPLYAASPAKMGVSTCGAFVSSHRARHVFCRAVIGGLLRRETVYQIFKKKQKLGGDETSDFKQKMSPAGQQQSFLLIKVLFFSTCKEKQPLQHHKQVESVFISSICAPPVLYTSINVHFYLKFLRHSTSFTRLRLLKQMALGICHHQCGALAPYKSHNMHSL